TALPFRLEPGPADPADAEPGWTPLRVGLTLSWAAALVALLAVGLGGWTLLDLSERRIRFVSAVTHELRTPLTTLRLYLDMLMNGLVRDEKQREEYIRTLHAEADRLTRLVGNLIDNACKYSRDAADRRIRLRARREGGKVVFEVEDRGPGVPAGERRAIFRSFRRGRSADVTAGGVGLGLALARRWAQLLGGK